VHGAFPKIDRWSARSCLRERTLQDCVLLRSAFGIALTNQLGTVGLQRDCYAVSLYGFKTSFAPSMKNLATG